MPLRRTQRSDGRHRPRWKDGSHVHVESTHANESRCNEIALESNRQTEPLVTVPQLLERSHENNVSTRDRPARTGADARIEESAAMGEVRLALRPYGRGKTAPCRGDFNGVTRAGVDRAVRLWTYSPAADAWVTGGPGLAWAARLSAYSVPSASGCV
jgi:hypothetical protein